MTRVGPEHHGEGGIYICGEGVQCGIVGKSLAVNSERKITPIRSRHRWENIINMGKSKVIPLQARCGPEGW